MFLKRQTSDISSDNNWQGMTRSGKKSENEWNRRWQQVKTNDREWQQMTTTDNKWQQVVITRKLPYFRIEESITKHPKEDLLSTRPCGRIWRESFELIVDLVKQALKK